MKAIYVAQYGGPEILIYQEIDKPVPGPGQILINVKAAGINPVDGYILSGTYAVKPPLPYTPGADGAGLVESVGPGVTRFKTGDRVYVEEAVTGTYAEYCLAGESHVHSLPESLSFAQGAALGTPYGTAYFGLFFLGKPQAGESLFIQGGSGGVGTAAIQLAKGFGLKVFATAGTDEGLELVKELGADYALNHHDSNYLKTLMDLTQGKGVNIIIELAAHQNLGKDLPLLASQGRVVVIGSRGPVEVNPRDLMSRNAAILGTIYMKATAKEKMEVHQGLADSMKKGFVQPIVNKELPLKDAAQGHRDVMAPGAHGKIVLIP